LSTLRNFLIIEKLKGRCDFVVGNPPWVRIHNISKELRRELFDKFEVYNTNKKKKDTVGWDPKLKNTITPFSRQIDYCCAFIESGFRYLKNNGNLGFVITAKITSVLYANLLRKFIIENSKILRIIDYTPSKTNYFKEAMNSPMIIAISKSKNNKTNIKITIEGEVKNNYIINHDLLPLYSNDNSSPWLICSESINKVFKKILKNSVRFGDIFNVSRGVMTSANDYFLLDEYELTYSSDIVNIKNLNNEKENIEKKYIRPVVKGKDVNEWDYNVEEYIIWTHDDKTGDVLNKLDDKIEKYFNKRSKKLAKRYDYKDKDPIWKIFRVNSDKLKQKLGWQEISSKMESVVIPDKVDIRNLGTQKLIPLQTVYFSTLNNNEDLQYFMAALLNSTLARTFFTSFGYKEPGYPPRIRHISWIVGLLPIPKINVLNDSNKIYKKIIELSKEMHDIKGESNENKEQIDELIAKIYNTDPSILDEMREYLKTMGIYN
jgi:hypothetical protein